MTTVLYAAPLQLLSPGVKVLVAVLAVAAMLCVAVAVRRGDEIGLFFALAIVSVEIGIVCHFLHH